MWDPAYQKDDNHSCGFIYAVFGLTYYISKSSMSTIKQFVPSNPKHALFI